MATLEIGRPALAVVDMQNDFVDPEAGSYAIGAEKMVTLGKRGTLHHRRLAAARLRAPQRRFFPRTKGVSGKQLREQWRRS